MSQQPVKSSSTAWYDSPLYYDMVYADYTKPETRFIEAVVRKHAPKLKAPLSILEPACGSGRMLESLARRGHRVQGFDCNSHQIRFAKNRLKTAHLKGKIWRDSLEGFSIPKGESYDVVHCLVSTFKYVLTEKGAVSSLQRMAKALRPGGLCLIGLHLTDYRNSKLDHERWIGRKPGIKVVSDTWSAPADAKRRREAMRTVMRITKKGKTRVEETLWDFRTYSPKEMKQLIQKVPSLRCVACYDFHYDLESRRRLHETYSDIILILQKRGSDTTSVV